MYFDAGDIDISSGVLSSPLAEAATDRLVAAVARWAYQALIREVDVTPKPGLVDRRNSGAHRDMNYRTFIVSAAAIAPYFLAFCRAGVKFSRIPASLFLPMIRPIGIACESAMLQATGGVNTHKGAIFSVGLLCAAAGRLIVHGRLPGVEILCAEVAAICANLVQDDLVNDRIPRTAGERLFRLHGIAGIRGEAASGYETARTYALPVFARLIAENHREDTALLQSLLFLMAHNQDTNLFGRGGMEGMDFVRQRAADILAGGGVLSPGGIDRMERFDDELISLHLSPGGSADLLAVCWLLSRFSSEGSVASVA